MGEGEGEQRGQASSFEKMKASPQIAVMEFVSQQELISA
jgi:hypothetical protein